MTAANGKRIAQCGCGALTATVSGDPVTVYACSCRNCQRILSVPALLPPWLATAPAKEEPAAPSQRLPRTKLEMPPETVPPPPEKQEAISGTENHATAYVERFFRLQIVEA